MKNTTSFEHKFLIAMPSLDDSWFEKAVIYIIEDTKEGTTGLVINKPHTINLKQLLDHFNLPASDHRKDLQASVLMGGPVEVEKGFILHQGGATWRSSLELRDNLALTVSEDFLQSLSEGNTPSNYLVCLGSANWSPNQLNGEILQNSWLLADYNASLIFETPLEKRWTAALGMLGVSPEFLSSEAGRA